MVVVRDRQHDKDELTIPEIMAVSSNIGAGKIALELGAKNLFYYMKAFGFGTKTDINFNGESQRGYILPYNKWTVVDTATKGYGYGIALTAGAADRRLFGGGQRRLADAAAFGGPYRICRRPHGTKGQNAKKYAA